MSSDDKRQTKDVKSLSRRGYVQALAAAGIAGVAGCGGDGGATATPTDEATATPTDTPEPSGPTPTSGTGETPEPDTATPTEPDTATATPREPQSDTIAIPIVNVPQQTNFNQHAPNPQNTGMDWFEEMANATAADSQTWFLNATFDAPWIEGVDQITIPTIQTDVRIKPPFDWWDTLHPELTYWDGTPIDAEARRKYHYVGDYAMEGGLFDSTMTFNHEVTGEFEIHHWNNKGEVEGQSANPNNRRALRNGALWGNVPHHPDFYKPYIQRYEDASSQSEAEEITSAINSHRISIFEFADKGWGSSLYRIESSDDISSKRAIAHLRDDHPSSDHATVPKFETKFADSNRRKILQNQGKIDVDEGLVKPEGARWVRSSLPDFIQQVDQWLQAGGTDQMLFNWHNQHLQRLWVRRAIIAAVDWIQVGINGWGSWKSTPADVHVGMAPASAKAFFPDEFLQNLHVWPMRSDTQLARQYMKNAGYTKTGGRWVGPDGNKISLRYIWPSSFADWVGRVQTVSQNLRDFGIGINLEGMNYSAWQNALRPSNQNYDISAMWGPGGPVLTCYQTLSAWYSDPLIHGPEGATGWSRATKDSTTDAINMPLIVQIPSNVGSIAAPEQAGRKPDLSAAGIDSREIDVADLVLELREPDTSKQEFMNKAKLLARFYNYYLPDFAFHQYATGLVGNVRDFNFAPKGHQANAIAPVFGADGYQIGGGLPQLKYDDEFPEPQTF